jgi:hypothetical protein
VKPNESAQRQTQYSIALQQRHSARLDHAIIDGGDVCTMLTGTLAGVILAPGVYCFDAAATVTGVLTLDGPADGIWVLKIGTSGTGALTGSSFSVVMAGGGQPGNVTWWVAQGATMTDSRFIGTILGGADITLTRGTFDGNLRAKADVTITGTAVTAVTAVTESPAPITAATITVTPNPDTLAANATQQFAAVGQDANGNIVSISPTWAVVANGGSISNTGLFTAGTVAGTFTNTVEARDGSVSGLATVVVTVVFHRRRLPWRRISRCSPTRRSPVQTGTSPERWAPSSPPPAARSPRPLAP